MTFEEGFLKTEQSAAAANKTIATLAGVVKQLRAAASEGHIGKMRAASERLLAMLEATRKEILDASSAWPFRPDEEESYLFSSYRQEVIKAGQIHGLDLQERDEGLLAFPFLLTIVGSERAVRINRKKVLTIRPSVLIKLLKAIQSKAPRPPNQFLELLHRAYRLLASPESGLYGRPIALYKIYEALTILPGANTTYDEADFLRDLYLLDSSGLTKTKSGAIVSFPAATGTKGTKGTYSLVTPDGRTCVYFGGNSGFVVGR